MKRWAFWALRTAIVAFVAELCMTAWRLAGPPPKGFAAFLVVLIGAVLAMVNDREAP